MADKQGETDNDSIDDGWLDAQVTEEWRQMEEALTDGEMTGRAEEILWRAQRGKGAAKCDSGLTVKQLK